MSKNTYWIAGIVIVILVVFGFVLFRKGGNEAVAPTSEEQVQLPTQAPVQPRGEQATTSAETPSPEGTVIIYSSSGFNPASITIKKGETVTFKNNSGGDFWPASAVHPTHAVYPEKGGCIGSKFDACKAIGPGGSFSFTFNSAGTWKYHDHLNPSFKGAVVVK